MVRVNKIGSIYYGIDEENCEGDFWEEVKDIVEHGVPVIVADTAAKAEEICRDHIEWVD